MALLNLNNKITLSKKCHLIILSIGFITFLFQKNVLANNNTDKDKNIIVLNATAQQMAGIIVTTVQPQALTTLIHAPGEVTPNANLTTKITTRVPAQVVQRYVQEGEHVKEGQLLVMLSSVDMAKTQGELLLAAQEWQRVKSLGKDAVSGKRYDEAQVNYQRAYSTALAYGMTENEINELLRTQRPTQAKGEFNLLAPRSGTVFNINFDGGELIEPGRVLLQIVDESTVWIDARLPPDLVRPIKVGDVVRIPVNERILKGLVIQVHHQLDETTRTRSIRIEISNAEDLLHPGQFVNCQIETGETVPMLAVPTEAIVRTPDGDLAVYVEKKAGEFQPVEIKAVTVVDKQTVIKGIPAGTRVVTKGAFFVHSELNKKGFDTHGH